MIKKKFPLSTTQVIMLSFLVVILVGSLLLSLPISTANRESVSYLDALFTATTATCVTGLVTLPTVTTWSIFGQVVILILIQIGGLGVITIMSALMILLPGCAIVFALLPASLPEKVHWPLVIAVVLCAAQAGLCVHALLPHILVDENEDLLLGSAMGDLEEYALFEPESLFIYDDTLVGSDLRVFPSYPDGVPDNVTFWGGWSLRSPESREQFARYDIDPDDVDPYAFVDGDVYFVSGRIDPPPMVVLDWLRAKIGPNVDYEIYSEYGYVYIFHFYEY